MEEYKPRHNWPEGSEIKWHKGKVYPSFKNDEQYTFTVFYPSPDSLALRPIWYTGKGFGKQRLVAWSADKELAKAEDNAWANYEQMDKCQHDFFRVDMSDEARSEILDGDASCRLCHIYIHNYFMDEKLYKAKMLAYEAHDGQKRNSGHDYILHPHEVYHRVAWWKILPREQRLRMACAAWLHDVLEDCPHIPPERIKEACGEDVLNLVKELTNPSIGVKAPRAVRKKMDREHLANASWEAKVIKLFDRICNLRDMDHFKDMKFIKLYAEESRALVECLKDVDTRLTDEALSWVRHLERLAGGEQRLQNESIQP